MFDFASLVPSIIGLGTKIGTAVPGLKKPKRSDFNSARAARAAQREVSRAAVSASQTGHGASRGLALREGLRAAVDATKYSDAAAAAAQADDAAYQGAKDARNERLASFGTDLAKGLGDMAALGVSAKSAQDGATEEPALTDAQAKMYEEGRMGGVSDTPYAEDNSQGLDDLEAGMADQDAMEQQQLIDEAGAQLEDFKLKREEAGISAAPEQKSEPETTAALIDQALTQKPEMAPEIEKELARTLHLKQLALSEMERTGSNFGEMIPRLNRRLGLSAGQTLQNPFGVGMDLDVTGEG